MLDTLLNIGCAFDWITPTIGLAESAKRGEMGSTFRCDDVPTCQWAMTKLKSVGIDIWAHGYDAWDDSWCFKVSDDDYERACRILGI